MEITLLFYDKLKDSVTKDKILYTEAVKKAFKDIFVLNPKELEDLTYYFTHLTMKI